MAWEIILMFLSKQLLVQSQQEKHQKKVWNMFKANKNTRMTLMTSLIEVAKMILVFILNILIMR